MKSNWLDPFRRLKNTHKKNKKNKIKKKQTPLRIVDKTSTHQRPKTDKTNKKICMFMSINILSFWSKSTETRNPSLTFQLKEKNPQVDKEEALNECF